MIRLPSVSAFYLSMLKLFRKRIMFANHSVLYSSNPKKLLKFLARELERILYCFTFLILSISCMAQTLILAWDYSCLVSSFLKHLLLISRTYRFTSALSKISKQKRIRSLKQVFILQFSFWFSTYSKYLILINKKDFLQLIQWYNNEVRTLQRLLETCSFSNTK